MTQPPTEPEIVQAFIDHTKLLTNTNAMASGRISGRLRTKSSKDPSGWAMPTFAIVYRAVPGPSTQGPGNVPTISEPMQIECYGPTLRESRRLWLVLRKELFPDPIQQILNSQPPTPHAFTAASCAVMYFQQMGAASPLQESPTDFPRTVATLQVTYCTQVVPIT